MSSASKGEARRVVTTLFCDLVGFTALSERNDPEVVNAFLSRYYSAARRVIESYGGTVEKFIGDAVVAVFGVPTLHEDDPERAVRAGLRLVDEIDALPGVGGKDVEVRVGVNTGEALVRLDVDPASGQGFLTGDAVNVAARLQSAAPPMAVAVGEATHAATEKVFAFDACHPVALKGKSKPLQAWLATSALARTGSELRTFSSSFVGREEELAALQELLYAASNDRRPQFALICGAPGIGKSRLLAELARRLDDQPTLVTWRQGRCLPFGSGVTFWALSEIVRDSAGILESDGVARAEARLETVLPDTEDRDRLRARLRPLLGLEADEASREENFSAWREFLEGLAFDGPAVLVVEDLHWADEAMLAFMDYLAKSDASVPLLVLATARTEVLELGGPGAAFVAAATHVPLGPLSGEETAELARARLGAKSLPTDLQVLILERSGGNPLFAEELVRLLEDRGLLDSRGGKVALKEGVEVPTPDSIGALIAARLDLLSPDRKALLSDAAVVGRTFWTGAVAAVGGREPAEVLDGLMELVAKELVAPVRGSSMEGETEFLFVHALVCDVAYEQLTRADRAAKHAALARWLEERTAGRTEDLAEVLAYHYGTALEMANSCGLFDLEDELSEPTARYLEMAGGRAAPLDSAAAAAHFARAERVADEAAKPKRRFFLSRRTRRILKRRAPLLAAAAAVIAVAALAAFAIYELKPAGAKPAPGTMTVAQIKNKYAPGVVRITARVPFGVNGRLTWKRIVGSGFVISKQGMIVTNDMNVDRGYFAGGAPSVGTWYSYDWVSVEFWGAQGQHTTVRGYFLYNNPFQGVAFIVVDPHAVHLVPIPPGDSETLHKGETVVALSRNFGAILGAPGRLIQTRAGAVTGTNYTNTGGYSTGTPMLSSVRTDIPSFDQGMGGPLLDLSGHVVGVFGPAQGGDSGGSPPTAAAIDVFLKTLRQVNKDNSGNRTFMESQDWWVDRETAAALGYPEAGGLVATPDPGGPAARAGIRGGTRVKVITFSGTPYQFVTGGDLIVSLDGKRLTSGKQEWDILNSHRPGDTVVVGVLRGHRHLNFKVKLEAFPYTPPTG